LIVLLDLSSLAPKFGWPTCDHEPVTLSAYASFLIFAIVLILAPGPDFAVVTRNTLVGGRRRGGWTALGVASAAAIQGVAAAAGLGAVIAGAQPVLEVIKWAGIVYLAYLAVQAFRSAVAGQYRALDAPNKATGVRGWRQGFMCNVTNPKVLVFYLAVLPQFLGEHAPLWALIALALTHAVLSVVYLMALVQGLHAARRVLARRRVRRALDAVTGIALFGFSMRLATE
jgi:threonine/homoserine/homoserine lactone efflux protein